MKRVFWKSPSNSRLPMACWSHSMQVERTNLGIQRHIKRKIKSGIKINMKRISFFMTGNLWRNIIYATFFHRASLGWAGLSSEAKMQKTNLFNGVTDYISAPLHLPFILHCHPMHYIHAIPSHIIWNTELHKHNHV